MKIADFTLGPTGDYTHGKLDPTDRGGVNVALFTDHGAGVVRMEFGTRLSWVSFTSDIARAWATELRGRADALDRLNTDRAEGLAGVATVTAIRRQGTVRVDFGDGRTEIPRVAFPPGVARLLAAALVAAADDLDKHKN